MVLIRIFVLHSLKENVRIFARHVRGVDNYFADALSRLQLSKFHKLAEEKGKSFDDSPTEVPEQLWPMTKIWLKN